MLLLAKSLIALKVTRNGFWVRFSVTTAAAIGRILWNKQTHESRKAPRPERSGDGEDDGAFQCGGRGEQGFGAG